MLLCFSCQEKSLGLEGLGERDQRRGLRSQVFDLVTQDKGIEIMQIQQNPPAQANV